jgi:hypothetical protein
VTQLAAPTLGTPDLWKVGTSNGSAVFNVGFPNGGFVWRNTVTMPAGFTTPGSQPKWNYLQLESKTYRYRSRTSNKIRTITYSGIEGLDTLWPVNRDPATPFDATNAWKAGTAASMPDAPNGLLADGAGNGTFEETGEFSMSQEFKTYIMFNPGGILDQWVPLRYVTWGWKADVAYIPDLANNPTAPFRLDFATTTPPAGPFNTTTHPVWEHNMADPINGGENAIIDDPNQQTPVFGD